MLKAIAKIDHETFPFEQIVTVGSFLLLFFGGLFLTFVG